MLAAITDQLREALEARGVPYPVVYGPESLTQSPMATSHIVVQRDRATGDTFLGGRSNTQNPPKVETVAFGAKTRVYAKSTLSGANSYNHERLADAINDQIVLALKPIIINRMNAITFTSARLLTAAELGSPALQRWPGVVYEMKFRIERSILQQNFAGESADTATMGGSGVSTVGGTIDVSDSPSGSTILPKATTRLDSTLGGFSIGFSAGFEGGA
jgi:hypothetical protein